MVPHEGHVVGGMLWMRLRRLLLPMVVVFYTSFLLLAVFDVQRTMENEQKQVAAMVHNELPSSIGVPPITQESLYRAIAMYNIRIPHGVAFPTLDPNLQDRGLTSLNPWTKRFTVKIGPAAFQSWALLGSTLAHEFEVHCRQSFLWIHMQDLVGLNGTDQAEREAYAYEISSAPRFGLSADEIGMIQETVDYYYPIIGSSDQGPDLSARVSRFFSSDDK